MRLGVATHRVTKSLADFGKVVTRYRPGSMIYEIADVLRVTAVTLDKTEGLALRVEWQGADDSRFRCWLYGGGVNGQRGARDGDIGTERVPVGEFFQLQPAFCQGNAFDLNSNTFTLRCKSATIAGIMPPRLDTGAGETRPSGRR